VNFRVPNSTVEFEVPDDWWTSAGMGNFVPSLDHYTTKQSSCSEIVAVEEVEPPVREMGFRGRESVIAVLTMMRTGEELEPIEVWSRGKSRTEKYVIRHGYHRFYLSVAIRYPKLPIKVTDFVWAEFLEKERKGEI
jgi:hypothetical protein